MNPDYHHHYRRWHDDSPAHLAHMIRHFGDRMQPYLPENRHAAILDVGCGMGFALEALRAKGYDRLEGVDPDPRQVADACTRGFQVVEVTDTAAWLRARPAQYDVVILFDVLEHVPRTSQLDFLGAIHATLTPGGRIICSVPNATSTLAPRQRYMDWTHHTSFTEHSLDFVLHNAGFRDITVIADDGPPKPLPWLPLWRRRWWYVRGILRAVRRLQLMAEIGPEEGRHSPLSINLLGTAVK